VDDVVDAAMLAVGSSLGEGEVLNVASGRHWTNEEVVAAVERCSGRTIRLEPFAGAARPWDSDHWMADITKAKQLLDWTPKRDLDTGLTETIRWHDNLCRTGGH
jgi:nucleoside-diphosphate-sugar epimerase